MSNAARVKSMIGPWSRHLSSKAFRGIRRLARIRIPSDGASAVPPGAVGDRTAVVESMARDESLGLDYVVCGMPRGGTTFFAELLNAHPDLYCYFMETAIFRQLWMFGADRPFPPENLGVLRDWLQGQLKAQLIDSTDPQLTAKYQLRLVPFLEMLKAHKLDEETGPGLRVFDQTSLEQIIQDLLELFRKGLYGAELFKAGNRLLGAYLRRRTKRSIVGEKTPDNLTSLDLLMAGNPRMQILCVVREPYTTMESMKRRAQQEGSIYNAAFSASFFGALAQYYGSLATIVSRLDELPSEHFHVIRYEDLLEDSEQVVENALGVLGLVPTEATREIASNFVIPTPTAHSPRDVFSDKEIAVADYALRPLLRRVGYGEDFFHERGLSVGEDVYKAMDQELIIALSGVSQEAVGRSGVDGWMADKAELLLVYRTDRSRLAISLHSDFPSQLGSDFFELIASNGGRTLAKHAVGPGVQGGRLNIELDQLESDALGQKLRAAKLSLTATHAYRPITLPGTGRVMIKLSFLLKAERFD